MQPPADTTRSPAERLSQLAGGRRGLVEGGLPPVAFVVTNAAASSHVGAGAGLRIATGAAVAAGIAVTVLALLQQRPLRPALAGLAGLAVAAGCAAWANDARAYFLPGIWVDATYALALAGSVVVRRPLMGTVYGWLSGRPRPGWWGSDRIRRDFALVTVGWAALYATRTCVQAALYALDEPGLLAAAKLGLGWPLTVVAAGLSLGWLRRRHATEQQRAAR